MWLITTQGFFSAVAHRDDPNKMLVRGRIRGDLESLKTQLPKAKIGKRIFRDRSADYEWRIELSREEWATAVAAMATEVDYDNFKSAVYARQGRKREGIYHRVWDQLIRLERDHYGRRRRHLPPLPERLRFRRFSSPLFPMTTRLDECPTCEGTGEDPDALTLACPDCFGFGDVPKGTPRREVPPSETLEASVAELKRGSRR